MSLPIDKSESKYCGRNFKRSRIEPENWQATIWAGLCSSSSAYKKPRSSTCGPSHELFKWAETHAPEELAALREKHPFVRVLRAVVKRGTELNPSQAYERRTRSGRRSEQLGLIEYQFGGQAQARAGFPYDPTCLDDILMGRGVTMEDLEILFGMRKEARQVDVARVVTDVSRGKGNIAPQITPAVWSFSSTNCSTTSGKLPVSEYSATPSMAHTALCKAVPRLRSWSSPGSDRRSLRSLRSSWRVI